MEEVVQTPQLFSPLFLKGSSDWDLVDLENLQKPVVPKLDELGRGVHQPCQHHPQQTDHHHEHAEHAEQDQDVPVEEGEGDVAGGVVGGGGGALPVHGDPDLAHR